MFFLGGVRLEKKFDFSCIVHLRNGAFEQWFGLGCLAEAEEVLQSMSQCVTPDEATFRPSEGRPGCVQR